MPRLRDGDERQVSLARPRFPVGRIALQEQFRQRRLAGLPGPRLGAKARPEVRFQGRERDTNRGARDRPGSRPGIRQGDLRRGEPVPQRRGEALRGLRERDRRAVRAAWSPSKFVSPWFWQCRAARREPSRTAVVCLWIGLLLLGRLVVRPARYNTGPFVSSIDLASPAVVTGTFYDSAPSDKKSCSPSGARRRASGIRSRWRRRSPCRMARWPAGKIFITRPAGWCRIMPRICGRTSRGSILVDTDPQNPKKERVSLEQIRGAIPGRKPSRAWNCSKQTP